MKSIYFPLIFLTLTYACTYKKSAKSVIDYQPVASLVDEIEQLYKVELLPQYRNQSRVAEISSYDTTGGNNDGFSGLFSYLRKEGNKLLIADLKGPGIIERIWTPTPTEDTIQFYFDGESEPRINIPFMDLFSGKVFPFIHPLAGNEVGGYYCYIPIPFGESCKIMFVGEKILFHQIQYRIFDDGKDLQSFPKSWTERQKESLRKACELWKTDMDNLDPYIDSRFVGKKTEAEYVTLNPGDKKEIFRADKGGRILKFFLEPSEVFSGLYKDILLEIQWDNDKNPAVYCPVADFFGYSFGKPSMQGILSGSKKGRNYCYLPMPFDHMAVIRLIYKSRNEIPQQKINVKSVITWVELPRDTNKEGKFYTQWRREINPAAGKSYEFMQSDGKGHLIGTILQAQGLKAGMTQFFEGDDSTVVDGIMKIHGTGSEDYFNGGWYALLNRWDKAFSLPIHGCLEYSIPFSRTGGYRFYLTDKISYEKSLLHSIEHGPAGNKYPVDYTSVTFYYADRPPEKIIEPVNNLRRIYIPDTLMILADNMNISIGLHGSVEFSDWGVNKFSGLPASQIKILMNHIPKGRYKMEISYLKQPEGSIFSVWQRQQRVSENIDSKAVSEIRINDQFIGNIIIDDNYHSVTFRKESDDKSGYFIFYGIKLIRF